METTPLTYLQQPLADGTGKLWLSYDLRGPLDVKALIGALRALVARHDALRLRIVRDASGAVRQYATDPREEQPSVTLQQVATGSLHEFVEHVRSRLVEELQIRYDLVSGPPARYFLFRLAPDRHVFCAVFSRLAIDGRSRMLFAGEFWDAYARLHASGEPPAWPQAPSFLSAARRSMALHEKRAATTSTEYWHRKLAPDPSFGQLAAFQAREPDTAECRMCDLRLLEPALARLAREAAAARCTRFEVLFARIASVLADALELDRLVVLTLNDFRTVEDRDVLGSFVRAIPIVLDRATDGGPAIPLAQVQAALLRARVHGYLPAAALDECYRLLEDRHRLSIPKAISFTALDHTAVRTAPARVADLEIGRGPGVPDELLAAPTMDILANVEQTETYVRLIANLGAIPDGRVDAVVAGLVRSLDAEVAAAPVGPSRAART